MRLCVVHTTGKVYFVGDVLMADMGLQCTHLIKGVLTVQSFQLG